MAGRKKENYDRGRVEFMASPDWIERAMRAAIRLGHGNLSSFIRAAVTEVMDRHPEIDRPLPQSPVKSKPRRKSSE